LKLGIGHLSDVLLRILILLLLKLASEVHEGCSDDPCPLGATVEPDIPSKLDIADGDTSCDWLGQHTSELDHSLISVCDWECRACGEGGS